MIRWITKSIRTKFLKYEMVSIFAAKWIRVHLPTEPKDFFIEFVTITVTWPRQSSLMIYKTLSRNIWKQAALAWALAIWFLTRQPSRKFWPLLPRKNKMSKTWLTKFNWASLKITRAKQTKMSLKIKWIIFWTKPPVNWAKLVAKNSAKIIDLSLWSTLDPRDKIWIFLRWFLVLVSKTWTVNEFLMDLKTARYRTFPNSTIALWPEDLLKARTSKACPHKNCFFMQSVAALG